MYFFVVVVEIGSCSVAQASFELLGSNHTLCLSFLISQDCRCMIAYPAYRDLFS